MVRFHPKNYSNRLDTALEACLKSGDRIFTAPEYAKARITNPFIFQQWTRVLSFRIGCQVNGKSTALYWHPSIQTHEELKQIADELRLWYSKGLTQSSALRFPRDRYLELLEEAQSQNGDSRNLWYIPSSLIDTSTSGFVDLDNALNTTEIVPFLSSVDLARRYVKANKNLDRTQIGVRYRKNDSNEEEPQCRVLVFGGNSDDVLNADVNYDGSWRFAGVPSSAEDVPQKVFKLKDGSPLDLLLQC